ncbi:Guanine nucleotide exchange factor for Cdc42p [Marasmius tenuissimus]|uniref:Guanine nucleotide exchange factor for Cdc42p n=1 Tax=Marasmius tenuissimus TaxID=585030 RepID=A0ABR2ZD16_9AGAR
MDSGETPGDRKTTAELASVDVEKLHIFDALEPSTEAKSKQPLLPTSTATEKTKSAFQWDLIVQELVETERKYCQDLEILSNYATAAFDAKLVQEGSRLHRVLSCVKDMSIFHQRFFILIKDTSELPWEEQRWGKPFIDSAGGFRACYDPYVASDAYGQIYETNSEDEANLASMNNMINAKFELPAFIKKPLGRVCKYPLLLDSLVKAARTSEHPHGHPYLEELKAGCTTHKQTTDAINDLQRQTENERTKQKLLSSVEDWKGHNPDEFGKLLLNDVFVVTKNDVDREYWVYLFDRILVCCKEPGVVGEDKKASSGSGTRKSGSLLSKRVGPPKPMPPFGMLPRSEAVPGDSQYRRYKYSLTVVWKTESDGPDKGEDGDEGGGSDSMTIQLHFEEQLRQWEEKLKRIIPHAEYNLVVDTIQNSTPSPPGPPTAKATVHVHFGESDVFNIRVPKPFSYDDLVQAVERKLKNFQSGTSSGAGVDSTLVIKYKDKDGDLVSLTANEDVREAVASGEVDLYVALRRGER